MMEVLLGAKCFLVQKVIFTFTFSDPVQQKH